MNKKMLYWWGLLLGVFIIHNLEELILDMYAWEQTHDLPSWADSGRRFHESIQLTSFKFILIIIAICVMVVGIAYSLRYRLFFPGFG